jgi:ketosteroid isomerase-like protein
VGSEALAVVRRIYEAWDRQESARDFIAEDVEYVNPPYAVEPGIRYGRKSFAVIRDTYADYELEVLRMVEAGDDEVVVLARYSGTGGASGVRVEGEQGFVWTVRDGVAVRFRWFGSQREALEAAGLPAD